MNRNFPVFKCAIVALAVLSITACSKSRFEQIEDQAEEVYKILEEKGEYCKAQDVAEARIDVMIDNETPDWKYLKHSLAWQKKAKEMAPKCQEIIEANRKIEEEKENLRRSQQQEAWDKQLSEVKPLVDKKIDEINKKIAFFDQLQNIRMVALPQLVTENVGHFRCVSSFKIINNSPAKIESLSFKAPQSVLNHTIDIKRLNFADNPIAPNETRHFELCFFYEREISQEIELNVINITPVNDSNAEIAFYAKSGKKELLEQVNSLKHDYESGDLISVLKALKVNQLVIPVGTSISDEEDLRQNFNPAAIPFSLQMDWPDRDYPIIPFNKENSTDNQNN